jgi:fumarylacetoacetase
MAPALDQTHDPALRSWLASANGHADFPIQNLPLGVFRPRNSRTPRAEPRGGIAIGDSILDLRVLRDAKLLDAEAQLACDAASGTTLNPLLALGSSARVALRRGVSALLSEASPARPELLHLAANCELLLPAAIGDYTDFYAGIHHATNAGKLFRPDQPLLPNYKWVPIGYHGRASSVRASGEQVIRPSGQRKAADELTPTFAPTERLDYELELGIWLGPGNALGSPIGIAHASEHIAGYCLLNDWSARDIQAWEYQPLGPFLAKSFHTTVSCWIVTPEALAPFRQPQTPRSNDDPKPLPYLLDATDQTTGALDITLEVLFLTPQMRAAGLAPQRIAQTNTSNLYWTPQQLLTHHASNGCNLRAGDLLGTGTISSHTPDGLGSLLELTHNGQEPLTLANGEQRTFLVDGDEVILRARTHREGFVPIGFGECRSMISGH